MNDRHPNGETEKDTLFVSAIGWLFFWEGERSSLCALGGSLHALA